MTKTKKASRGWRIPLALIAIAVASLSCPGAALAQRCYNFVNSSGGNVMINFTYPPGLIDQAVLNHTLIPNEHYSFCVQPNVPSGPLTFADINVGRWANLNGRLGMGNGPNATPPGTYTVVSGAPPQPPGPQFGNSSYPGHEKFMVTHVDGFNYPMPGLGQARFINISITCRNGQRWKLVCLPDGSKCNVSLNEYLHGLTQWNVGQHCDGAHGNAD